MCKANRNESFAAGGHNSHSAIHSVKYHSEVPLYSSTMSEWSNE